MLWIALLAPLIGALLTYCRGATIPGAPPAFLNKWLLTITDEPRWTIQRGWLVALIGVWPGAVVWLLTNGHAPSLDVLSGFIPGFPTLQSAPEWLPIAASVAASALSSAAFTLGHAVYQDYGTWAPPPDYVPEDTYLHDFGGMIYTGGAMTLGAAAILAWFGLYVAAGVFLAAGASKAIAYSIGWTRIGERVIGPYWEPTRLAEVLQGAFLYGGVSAALLWGA